MTRSAAEVKRSGPHLTYPALHSRGRIPLWVLCHEHHRSKRRCGTVREMKEGPSGSAIRSLIPSPRKLLWSKVTRQEAATVADADAIKVEGAVSSEGKYREFHRLWP